MPNFMYTKKTNVQSPAPVTTVPPKLNAALGRGLAFPLKLWNNSWQSKGGVDKVKQDIFLTLATPVGSRFLYPSFGSMLPFYQYKLITPQLLIAIQNHITTVLTTWVPYINLTSVTVTQLEKNSNAVGIDVAYSIVSTQSQEQISLTLNDIDNIAPSEFAINGVSVFKVKRS